MAIEEGVGLKIKCENGRTYAIKNDSPAITRDGKEFRIGIDITKEPTYVVIGTFVKNGKTYTYVDNDSNILVQLLGLDVF